MAVARDERHRYGQHYTPPDVARILAAFAIRSATDLVFDPSCGDGKLLVEALRFKNELAPRRPAQHAREVFGVDRSAHAVELGRSTGAQVAVCDFFDVEPTHTLKKSAGLPAAFDAILGNPPYIRQELIGKKDKRRIENRLKTDRVMSPDIHWPHWSGRSDIYVSFFAHAIRFLKPEGRLVFLTASSWLDVAYGAALREFLLENFRVIAVIESSREGFFENASINTAITVLEREADAARRKANHIRFVRLTRPLTEILSGELKASGSATSAAEFADSIERTLASGQFDTHSIRVVPQGELVTAGKPSSVVAWGKFLRADDVFFRVLERGGTRLQPLSDFARVRFGVKTGANEFFYLKEDEQGAKGKGQREKGKGPGLLALANVASVRRGLTTGANEFFYLTRNGSGNSTSPISHFPSPIIEPQYLSPVVFSLKEISGILLDHPSTKKLFFNCPDDKEDLRETGALCYIRQGERAGFHRRPTCASRDPWYSVARGMKPAPLIFPSKVGERWVVALNQAGVFEDKKLYGVFPAEGVSKLVLAALLNSTWARYYAEVTCRQMTGVQAIADIDVAVAERIVIPDPRQLSASLKKKLEAAILTLSHRPVYSVFEELNHSDRRKLDALTLEAIGFRNRSERSEVLANLYVATTELVRSRLSKSAIKPGPIRSDPMKRSS